MPDEILTGVLAALAESSDLVAVVDQRGALVGSNRAAAARSPEATQATDHVAADARAELARAIEQVLAGGASRTFEWGDVGPGGVVAWFRGVVDPIGTAGALVSSRDVTDLKRAEERMRRSEELMVDTQGVAHLGTWEWDVTLPTATWSAELYRIYGLTPAEYTPSYEAYLTKIHPDDRQRVIDATNRVFHEHVPYSHDERIFRPDGTMRYLHTWAHPVLDQTGKLLRLVGVCQDITDRKLAEEALQQLNAELEQRVIDRTRDLENFNSMVSHDLRGPLSVFPLAIHVIRSEPDLPEKVLKATERIERAGEIMTALVDDLLAFARVGESALQPGELDVSAMCQELIAELRVATPTREVSVAIAPGLRMHADRTLMRVVVGNLITNAWKYTGETAAPRIEIDVDGHALVVRDNGVGFDMAERPQLFRPFSRLASARSFAGTGIGLATVARIVERHGGAVDAVGEVGQGATFRVQFPPSVWR